MESVSADDFRGANHGLIILALLVIKPKDIERVLQLGDQLPLVLDIERKKRWKI